MLTKKRIILGVDPGSRITGYAVIWVSGNQQGCITHGTIQLKEPEFSDRLHTIFSQLCDIITTYQPTESAIESVFIKNNVASALKLGQARGAAIVACAHHHLPVAEYSPREIKQASVGYGNADKKQVQEMVKMLFQLTKAPTADAADALAIALCHANHRSAIIPS